MRIFKRSFFTLIEMMIVLFIMSMGVAVTGIKLKEAYDEQRFLSESNEVLDTLALAQDLMLIQDADVQFTLAYNNESQKFECWIDVEKPLTKMWVKLVERKLDLKAIKSFDFDNNYISGPLNLTFSLGKMSKGTLTLYAEKEKKKQTEQNTFKIYLPGYPSPLVTRAKNANNNRGETAQVNDQLYPTEVYEEIYKVDTPTKE